MGWVEVRGLRIIMRRHSVLPHFEDVRGLNEKKCDARGDAAVHEGLGLVPHPSEPHELIILELHRPSTPPRHESVTFHSSEACMGQVFWGRKISWEMLPRRFWHFRRRGRERAGVDRDRDREGAGAGGEHDPGTHEHGGSRGASSGGGPGLRLQAAPVVQGPKARPLHVPNRRPNPRRKLGCDLHSLPPLLLRVFVVYCLTSSRSFACHVISSIPTPGKMTHQTTGAGVGEVGTGEIRKGKREKRQPRPPPRRPKQKILSSQNL